MMPRARKKKRWGLHDGDRVQIGEAIVQVKIKARRGRKITLVTESDQDVKMIPVDKRSPKTDD